MAFADTIKSLPQWAFLNEPIWRWFVFLVVISLLMNVWKGVLDEMK